MLTASVDLPSTRPLVRTFDPYMTPISGDFSKAPPDGANNNVTVNGIGTGATIEAPSATTSNVAKIEGITNTGAGSVTVPLVDPLAQPHGKC